jgi:hypothetical protein
LDDRKRTSADRPLLVAVARVDPVALGAAVGVVGGLAVFMATLALVLRGGEPIGPNLELLAQYFIGYTVTPLGSVVGLLYGAAAGFGVGWLTAALRNSIVSVYLRVVRERTALAETSRMLDP